MQTRQRLELVVPVGGRRLRLGTRQEIARVECDGPREREIAVDVPG